jgi:hypothetical protein
VHQECNVKVGDVTSANPYGVQHFPAHAMGQREADVSQRRLDWIGRHAFTARYAVQPVVDLVLGMRWGPRHDQSVSHHLDTVNSPTGLVYAYDRTWDEYAVLAIDIPTTAVEAAMGRTLARDAHPTLEVFAGLLADSLTAPTRTVETSTELSSGIEL